MPSPKTQKPATADALKEKWQGKVLWETKLMFALSSAWGSSFANFVAVYYQQTAGFSKVQIGFLQTLPSVASILGPPFWGSVADRLRNQRLVHNFCILSGALLTLVMSYFYWSFGWTIVLLLLSQFQGSPAGSMLDHATLNLLEKVGGEYGKQRLFGAVGWGISSYITGVAVTLGGIYWSFYMSAILAFIGFLMLRLIPAVEYPSRSEDGYTVLETGEGAADGAATEGEDHAPSFLESVRLITQKKDVLVLLVAMFFMGLMYGVLSSFLTLNLYNLSGENPQIIGVAIMCETTSELPAFFYSGKLIKKIGTVNVLLVSIAGYALRISYYAVMTNAWSAIPFEFLHGLTFGLAWSACTQYLYTAAPPSCQGTVMGILNAVQNGLARATGTLVGGYFYQHYGARVMWLVADLGVPLSLLAVAVFAYLKREGEILASNEEVLQERAALFSPHDGDPTGLKSPRHLTYDSVEQS